METSTDNLFFILGGQDNEMAEIIKVLEKHGQPYWQPQLEWGNIKIDNFTLPHDSQGKHLVFVECRPAWLREEFPLTPSLAKRGQPSLYEREGRVSSPLIIDHHNHLSENPASLLQVLKLLHLKPTIRQQIIASIDSDFLSRTIAKWPTKKRQILKIWEDGYRKKFDSEEDYLQFKDHCWNLFKQAVGNQLPHLKLNPVKLPLISSSSEEGKSRSLFEKEEEFPLFVKEGVRGSLPLILIIQQAPDSRTMLAAMADLAGVECCLISGTLESDHLKPCSYIGKSATVIKLANQNFPGSYWGKYYFGCRAVPGKFVNAIP